MAQLVLRRERVPQLCRYAAVVIPCAMVLAAGLGTRLRPLSEVRAKPLVPVGDRPALAHVFERLRAAGVGRIVVNAHHRAQEVRAFVDAQPGDLAVSEEPELLGTAGGLAQARDLLGDGDVLVWNADILAAVDPRALAEAHARDGPEATLVVQPMARGAGSVGLDASGRIVRLRRERFGEEASGGEFLGIHVVGGALRQRLPPRGGLIEDLYIPALARGATLRALLHEDRWHDVGTVAAYLEANLAWLDARGLASWSGAGARVSERVALDRCVIGAGATVDGEGSLARCVVWPGARAAAPLHGAVVTS
jgi:mannose-1-phosphate guanylyltransferase